MKDSWLVFIVSIMLMILGYVLIRRDLYNAAVFTLLGIGMFIIWNYLVIKEHKTERVVGAK